MYKVYTDGACRGNPGIGSWAMCVYLGHSFKGSKSGFKEVTTNNEMELMAIVEVAKWTKRLGKPVEVFTDSAYSCNGYNQWMHGWATRMWRGSKGNPIKNLELWRELYHLSKEIDLTVTKVKGHAGIEGNERADNLCNVEMDTWELQNITMK